MQRVLGVSQSPARQQRSFIAQQPQYTFNGLKKLRPALTQRRPQTLDSVLKPLGQTGHVGEAISIKVGQCPWMRTVRQLRSGTFTPARFQDRLGVVYATYST